MCRPPRVASVGTAWTSTGERVYLALLSCGHVAVEPGASANALGLLLGTMLSCEACTRERDV